MMPDRWLLLVAGLAALAVPSSALGQALPAAPPPSAQATSAVWRVEGGGGLDHFLAGLANAAQHHEAACMALQQAQVEGLPDSGQIWLRAGNGQVRLLLANEQGLDRLDTPWAKAALAAAAVAERLGSLAIPLDIWLRWQDGTYSVGTRNQAGQHYDDPCHALGHVVALLMAANHPGLDPHSLPMAPRQALGEGLLTTQIVALGRVLARQSVLVGQGNVVTIALDALPFAGQPTLATSAGITIQSLRQQDGRWLVDLAVASAATRQNAALAIFAPGQRFQPVYTVPLTIVAGDNSGATSPLYQAAETLQAGQTISGQIAANSIALHSLELTQQGHVLIRSDGASDVKASLLDAQGVLITTDDDGAGNYHFLLTSTLPAGKYLIRVEHCCKLPAKYNINYTQE